MTKDYSISQMLYVSKSSLREKVPLQNSSFVGNDAKFALISSDNETINSQYKSYREALELILNSISIDSSTEIVLSISIRAYEYIPEIDLSSDFIVALAKIGASIDIDVINMTMP